jgi:hypothetical protein
MDFPWTPWRLHLNSMESTEFWWSLSCKGVIANTVFLCINM